MFGFLEGPLQEVNPCALHVHPIGGCNAATLNTRVGRVALTLHMQRVLGRWVQRGYNANALSKFAHYLPLKF
jgi:hypothetical protein